MVKSVTVPLYLFQFIKYAFCLQSHYVFPQLVNSILFQLKQNHSIRYWAVSDFLVGKYISKKCYIHVKWNIHICCISFFCTKYNLILLVIFLRYLRGNVDQLKHSFGNSFLADFFLDFTDFNGTKSSLFIFILPSAVELWDCRAFVNLYL